MGSNYPATFILLNNDSKAQEYRCEREAVILLLEDSCGAIQIFLGVYAHRKPNTES